MAAPEGIWPSCAADALRVQESGNLELTREYLRRLYLRAEIAPVDESCENERRLHGELMEDPCLEVDPSRFESIADADARENYRLVLAYRDVLRRHPSIEAAYFSAVASDASADLPTPFLDLMTQTVLWHILSGDGNAFRYRAAELFFRTQRASVEPGLLLADAVTLDRRRRSSAPTPLELLIQEARGQAGTPNGELDVLNADNAKEYARRSEHFDFALDLALSGPGMAALCEMLARWLEHFHGVRPEVTAVESFSSEHWRWHIGLDRESNSILNTLYRGAEVDSATLARLIALFRMECPVDGFLDPSVEGRAIFLGLAMEDDGSVRLKPQNLIHNLPLATRS